MDIVLLTSGELLIKTYQEELEDLTLEDVQEEVKDFFAEHDIYFLPVWNCWFLNQNRQILPEPLQIPPEVFSGKIGIIHPKNLSGYDFGVLEFACERLKETGKTCYDIFTDSFDYDRTKSEFNELL